MLYVVQYTPMSGQREGASFVQTTINKHLWITNPNRWSAERKSGQMNIDTAHPAVKEAYAGLYEAVQGALTLKSNTDRYAPMATVIDIEADYGQPNIPNVARFFKYGTKAPELDTLREAMIKFDKAVGTSPELTSSKNS